jgi:hypothetical protein
MCITAHGTSAGATVQEAAASVEQALQAISP